MRGGIHRSLVDFHHKGQKHSEVPADVTKLWITSFESQWFIYIWNNLRNHISLCLNQFVLHAVTLIMYVWCAIIAKTKWYFQCAVWIFHWWSFYWEEYTRVNQMIFTLLLSYWNIRLTIQAALLSCQTLKTKKSSIWQLVVTGDPVISFHNKNLRYHQFLVDQLASRIKYELKLLSCL